MGGEGGGWWAHPPAVATLDKMALGTSGISQHWAVRLAPFLEVVKLTVSHYYSVPLPLQKRGYGDEIQNPVMFMIPSTGSGSGVGGHGMHNGCDFWN